MKYSISNIDYLILILAILMASCTFTFSSQPVYQTPSTDYHIVQENETIYSISQKYSIPVEKLMFFNNMKQERIFVGQKVYLYPRQKTKEEFVTRRSLPKHGYHIVREGETLHRLSKMYDVDILDLMDINNLTQFDLQKGMKIWLQEKERTETASQETVELTKKIEPKPEKKAVKQDLILPIAGKITSEFGLRGNRQHKGIDISAKMGDPILAVKDGKVVYTGTQRGYGNVVILEHSDLIMTVYAHNEANLVRLGEKVKQGQPIATVGNTGNSTSAHLHFEYRVQGKAINPLEVLPPF